MVVFSNTGMGAIARRTLLGALSREETGFFNRYPSPHLSYFREKIRLMRPGIFKKVGFPIALQNIDVHGYKFN